MHRVSAAAGNSTLLIEPMHRLENVAGDFMDLHFDVMFLYECVMFADFVATVGIYCTLHVFSLFGCHACIMQYGLCSSYSYHCVPPYLPSVCLLCPQIPQLSRLHGLSAARRSPRYQPISWWGWADTPLREDYSICLCSTNHPVSVPCMWIVISVHAKDGKVADKLSLLIKFSLANRSESMFLKTKRFFFSFLPWLYYSRGKWYCN